MVRILSGRWAAFACLFGGLAMTAGLGVYGATPPCFDTVNDIACPTMVKNDTCAVQFSNLPANQKTWNPPSDMTAKTNCEKFTYNARLTGKFTNAACQTHGTETGYRCIPVTDADGVVVRDICGRVYSCEFVVQSTGILTCQQGGVTTTVWEDVYTVTTSGCRTPP